MANTTTLKTITEIKRAVDLGIVVYADNEGYEVTKDKLGQYLITFTRNGHTIGLHSVDNKLNAETFYALDLSFWSRITLANGAPIAVTEDEYWEALEVLPPIYLGGVNAFAMMEAQCHNGQGEEVHHCFLKQGPRYYGVLGTKDEAVNIFRLLLAQYDDKFQMGDRVLTIREAGLSGVVGIDFNSSTPQRGLFAWRYLVDNGARFIVPTEVQS